MFVIGLCLNCLIVEAQNDGVMQKNRQLHESSKSLFNKPEFPYTMAGFLTGGYHDPLAGLGFETFISQRFGLFISSGFLGGSIGGKIYFPMLNPGRLSAHTGYSEGVFIFVANRRYVPIGLTYVGTFGLYISADAGYIMHHAPDNDGYFGFTLKIGQCFERFFRRDDRDKEREFIGL